MPTTKTNRDGEESINLDPNIIINNVGPGFVQASSNLEKAATVISSITIPDDFEYAEELFKMPSRIDSSSTSLKEIYSWIIDDIVIPLIVADQKNQVAVQKLSNTTYDLKGLRDTLLSGGVAVELPTETIYIVPGTKDGLLQCAEAVMKQYSTQGWEWKGLGTSGGLVYEGPNCDNTFENVINNENLATCCATFVSTSLYLAGFVTTEDFYFDNNSKKSFNPNLPGNVYKVCQELECEEIKDENKLQPGDIMFYWENNKMTHTDIYIGKNEEGEDLFYSAGDTREIQAGKPVVHNLEKFWWAALRLPEEFKQILDINGNNITENENVETGLNMEDNKKIAVNLGTNNNENNNVNSNVIATNLITNKEKNEEKDNEINVKFLSNTQK